MNRFVLAVALAASSVAPTFAESRPADQGKLCPKDVPTYLAGAKAGDAESMYCMGVKHSNVNTGVAHDDTQATDWFRKAAESGHAGGMFLTGIAFWSGRGIAEDKVEAYKWLELTVLHGGGTDATKHAQEGLSRALTAANISEAKNRAAAWELAYQTRKKSGYRAPR